MGLLIWLVLTILINIPIVIYNLLVIVYAVGMYASVIILHLHGFIVSIIMIPIHNIPKVFFKRPNQTIDLSKYLALGESPFGYQYSTKITTTKIDTGEPIPLEDWNSAKILIRFWLYVFPIILWVTWSFVLQLILQNFAQNNISTMIAIISATIAVISYYRIYREYPLPHRNTLDFLEKESLMRFQSHTDKTMSKVSSQSRRHKNQSK